MKLFYILCFCVLMCHCKTFTRCRLATELMKTKMITKTFLGNWVCLIEKVSGRNTRAYSVTPSGKKYYGLYQIPSNWCKEGKKGGECNIACEALLDDNIKDDTACAVQIFNKEGFKYWPQWTTRCKNDNLITNEIYKCPDLKQVEAESILMSENLKAKKRNTRTAIERSRLFDYYRFHWFQK